MSQDRNHSPLETVRRSIVGRGLSILFPTVILALVVLTAWSIWSQREQTLQRAARDTLGLALTLGEHAGHALAMAGDTVDTARLSEAFQQLGTDPRTVFRVVLADGRTLLSHPDLENAFAAEAAGDAPRSNPLTGSTTQRSVSVADGVERLYAYAHVATLPLTATVGVPMDSVLAAWREESIKKTAYTFGVLLFVSLLYWVLLRQRFGFLRGEAGFEHLFHDSPVPAGVFTAAGSLLAGNPSFFQMMGCRQDEAIGKTSVELGFWASAERWAAVLKGLLENGAAHQEHARLVGQGGGWADASLSAQLIDGDGEKRVLLIIQDTTLQRTARDELERISERLQIATRSIGFGVWDWDAQRDVLVWDEAMHRLYGRPLELPAASFESWRQTLHPDDRAATLARTAQQLESEHAYDSEFRILRGDGEVRHIKSAGYIQRDQEGRAARVIGVDLDVTDQRRAEQSLRHEATIRAIVKATAASLGEAFFRSLVVELASALNVRYAFAGESFGSHQERFRTVAICAAGEISKNCEYPLQGTPCEETITDGSGSCPQQVQQRFPNDRLLEQMQAQSYLGVRLLATSGHVLGVLGVMHDRPLQEVELAQRILDIFSVRAGAELERLQAEEQRRRILAILDETSDLVCSCDLQGNVLYLNMAARRWLDIGPEEDVRIRRISQLYSASALEMITNTGVVAAIQSGLWIGEASLQRAGGGEAPVSQLIIAHRSNDGKVEYLSTIMRDLTAHKQVEQALRVREQSLRMAQQVGNVGSWERDLATDDLLWSEQMHRIVRRAPEDFEVTVANWLSLVPPDDVTRLLEVHQDAMASWQGFSIDHCIKLPDGTLRYVHQRAEVMRNELGEPTRLLGTMQDITERKQAEEALLRTEQRFRQLAESTNVVPWAATPDNFRFTYVGPQAVKILGYALTEWYREGFWADCMHTDDRAWVLSETRAALLQVRDTELEYRMLTTDGSTVWLRHIVSVVSNDGGRPTLQGFLFDITERKRAEEQLRLAGEVFQTSSEGILITDSDMRIVSVNPAFSAITGHSAQDAVGQTPYSLTPGVRSHERDREIWDRVWAEGSWQGEVWDRRRNGDIYPQLLTVSVVRSSNGRPANYIEMFSDISERKAREERVMHLAHHDFLTDLPNRVLLNDRIAQAIALAERNQGQVALMFIDLDRFKNVNDSLGHSVGDKLLQEVSRRLRKNMRASDTVSRQGGDEFVILMLDVSDAADVARGAQKVLDALSSPYAIDGHELVTTPSIGISLFPSDGRDVETLLKNADAAMYHAKETGRNNYQFFTQDMNARALERLSLERSLRRAMERGELRLHYQPQYDVRSGHIIGVEALIRWQHPEHGLIPPVRFMPFAEESGLILPVGEWVLHEACRQNRAWQDQGLAAVRVAVNISALQFREQDFPKTVEAALRAARLDARYLELEVTESVIMQDAEQVTACLEQLKTLGLELAIDDFGTGYSSLSYLKRFPIDKLKIDRSFVRDITTDKDDAAITSAIIGLTHTLGLRTIAEGVETREQFEFLEREGCDEVQGFLFSKPLPADDCTAMLRAGIKKDRVRLG